MQPHWAQSQAQWNHGYSTAPPYPQAWQGYQNHSPNEQKGSCFDYGFCTEEQQNMAYEAMLSRLEEEGTFSSVTHDNGRLRINVPFAGRFAERKQLLPFLRREILEKRSEIREIHLFVTDVNDFYGAQEASGDPQIVLHFAVQDGRQPLPPADVVMGMHPDCSSSFLTSFWGYYQAYYYMWQEILRTALSSAPLAIFANLWLEESIEVQQVARHQGMAASHAIKNRPYYGHTVTAPLTSNCRDRQPFHYMVIAQREPGGESAKKIQAHAEDYTGPYQNQWTMYPPPSYPHWPYGTGTSYGNPALSAQDYWKHNTYAYAHPWPAYPSSHYQGPMLSTPCY